MIQQKYERFIMKQMDKWIWKEIQQWINCYLIKYTMNETITKVEFVKLVELVAGNVLSNIFAYTYGIYSIIYQRRDERLNNHESILS